MEGLWGLITVGGPILLAVVMAYAIITNRRRTRAQVDRTERATRDLYESPDPSDADDRR